MSDREALIDALVMSPMSDTVGTDMARISRTADEIWDDGHTALIYFDNEDGEGQGTGAPYSVEDVRHLEVDVR